MRSKTFFPLIGESHEAVITKNIREEIRGAGTAAGKNSLSCINTIAASRIYTVLSLYARLGMCSSIKKRTEKDKVQAEKTLGLNLYDYFE